MVCKFLPDKLNQLSAFVVEKTSWLKEGKGLYILRIIMSAGPFFFLPTVYEAWFAVDIEAFRTFTWPLMLVVHSAAFFLFCHRGSDWCAVLCTILWFLMTSAIVLAIIVR